jgi:hypothetical protein
MRLDPLEALDQTIGMCVLSHVHERLGPGGVVSRAVPEVREALQRLTSDATASQRVAKWACAPDWDPDPNVRAMGAYDRALSAKRRWPNVK